MKMKFFELLLKRVSRNDSFVSNGFAELIQWCKDNVELL